MCIYTKEIVAQLSLIDFKILRSYSSGLFFLKSTLDVVNFSCKPSGLWLVFYIYY